MKTFRLSIALACAAFVVLIGPSAAFATPYSLVLSAGDGSTPASLPAASEGTVRATYKNLTTTKKLGSSNLVVPSGLRIVSVSVPSGSSSISGNTIQLRNLNVPAGGTAVVDLRLAAAVPDCTEKVINWAAPATRQSNDFSSYPGSLSISLSQSELRTVVGGDCRLRFIPSGQPADARVDEAITAESYNPAGPPVAVEVVDSLGLRVPTSGLAVDASIGTNPAGGTISGDTTQPTTDGVASFSTLSIDEAAVGYKLVASSTAADPDSSSAFNIVEVSVQCVEDVDCTGELSYTNTDQQFGGQSSISATAIQPPGVDVDTGFLKLSRVGGPLDCSGYDELLAATDTVAVEFSDDDREKRVVSTLDKTVLSQARPSWFPPPLWYYVGGAFLEDCFGAPYTFATKPWTPLEVNTEYVPGPYPAPEYKGLLPDCGKKAVLDNPNLPGVQGPTIANAKPPCVEKRRTVNGGGVISSIWPSGLSVGFADPRRRV